MFADDPRDTDLDPESHCPKHGLAYDPRDESCADCRLEFGEAAYMAGTDPTQGRELSPAEAETAFQKMFGTFLDRIRQRDDEQRGAWLESRRKGA